MSIDTLPITGIPGNDLAIPAGWTGHGDAWRIYAEGAISQRNGTFGQLVTNTECSGVTITTVTMDWTANSVMEWGTCKINADRSGLTVIVQGQSAIARKEVATAPNGNIATASDLGMTDGIQVLVVTTVESENSFSVELNGVEIMSGAYDPDAEEIEGPFFAGAQNYSNADDTYFIGLSVENDTSGATISGGTNPVALGSTGNTINYTGLGTLTTLTIGGVPVASLSATGGSGTYAVPAWADAAVGIPLGTGKAIVAGDGSATASATREVTPGASKSWVQLTSVSTLEGYLGASATGLKVGTQIIFPTGASLGLDPGTEKNYIDVDGGIYTDYDGSQTLLARDPDTGIVSTIYLINGESVDTVPDDYDVDSVTNAAVSTPYTSVDIPITGTNADAPITIVGGTYSIDGGGFVSSSGSVPPGATVRLRLTSSSVASTPATVTATIGGVEFSFTVTTATASVSTGAIKISSIGIGVGLI